MLILQTPEPSNTNLLLVNDFTDLLPHQSLPDRRALLSSEDMKRVATVQLSYEQRIELGQSKRQDTHRLTAFSF